MKKLISYGISIVIAIAIIIAIEPYIKENKQQKQYAFNVSSIQGDLSLDTFKGKVLAVYFGYTFCPDVCPTSLSSLAQALNSFDEKKLKNFAGLFISVDPDRDKIKALDEYSKYFHPTFIGATSNKENIDDITKRYGSFYEKVYLENSSMDYSVSHTSYIYIFDKDGKFVEKIDHFSNPTVIKEVLKKLL